MNKNGGLRSGPSLNDPERWALTPGHAVPWESIVDESPFEDYTFQLPFDLCLQMAEGNKALARYFYYRPHAANARP